MSQAASQSPPEPPAVRLPVVLALTAAIALASGALIGVLGLASAMTAIAAVGVALLFPLLLVLRADEVVALVIVTAGLLIDWYGLVDGRRLFGLPTELAGVATLLGLLLVGTMALTRSPGRPWTRVPHLPLWGLLLVIGLYPMLQGESTAGGVKYYVDVFGNALLMFAIGVQIAQDRARVLRLMALLSAFGSLVAAHTVIYAKTGQYLLATHRLNDYLATHGGFALIATGAARAGSFLFNPDINGAFLALMLFLPLGIFSAGGSPPWRALHLAEAGLIAVALLFTYSTASLAAAAAGMVLFILAVSRGRRRLALCAVLFAMVATTSLALPAQLRSLSLHAADPTELKLREGAWRTGVNVALAYPLAGVGLDPVAYDRRSAPYRDPQQTIPLGHPHEAYIELAALAGLPVLVVFVVLVAGGLRLALRSYRRAPPEDRTPLATIGTAVVVLSLNSFAINGWTLAPVVLVAWLLLGVVASPAWRERAESPAPEPARRLVGTAPA